jgi:hypothetical protein
VSDLVFTVDGIDVDIEIDRYGLYYGTSKQVPGLRVAEANIEDVPRAVRQAIMDLKAAATRP